MVIMVRINKYTKNSLFLTNKKISINQATKYPIAKIKRLSGKEKKKAEKPIIEGITLR